MRKVIKIGEKEYSMKSSAYTQFKYKNDIGRGLLNDIQEIAKMRLMNEDEQVGKIEEMTEMLLRLAFIMIQEADSSQVKSFEDFLKEIDGLFDDPEWINGVVELASSPFSRGIQGNTPKEQK